MTLLLLIATVWLGISAGATLIMCGVCSGGRLEEKARAAVPAPRATADDLSRV